jgi:hypothetical protein
MASQDTVLLAARAGRMDRSLRSLALQQADEAAVGPPLANRPLQHSRGPTR